MRKSYFFAILCFSLFVIAAIFFGNLITKGFEREDNLRIVIFSEYKEYLKNQDVWLSVKIINDTEEDVYVKNFNVFNIDFDIKSPSGLRIHKIVEITDFTELTDSIKIERNNSIEDVFNLGIYMEKGPEELGTYTIVANFGGSTSNKISINVVEPEGEDKLFISEVFEILDSVETNNYFERRTQELEDLLNYYPNSKYTAQVYNYLFSGMYYTNETNTDFYRIQSNIEKFLNNGANTFGSEFVLDHYPVLLSKFAKMTIEQIDTRLIELLNRYAGTRSENFIKKQIKAK